MKYKNFDQYTSQYSKKESDYLNKIGIATSGSLEIPYFSKIENTFDLKEKFLDIPVIMSSDFSNESVALFESNNFTYNFNDSPSIDKVYEDFSGSEFIPKMVNSISDTKKLRFPITAFGKEKSEFKTIGKLRSSEGIYKKFMEKIVPKTRFNILSFKKNPISIIEKVNGFPLDVNINRFKYLDSIKQISEKLHEKYDLDFYNIEILESIKGGLFINDVNKKIDLNPHQGLLVYESAYNDFYNSRLPNWVKSKIKKEYISKYYQTKLYDSMLVKTQHTMDYAKNLSKC